MYFWNIKDEPQLVWKMEGVFGRASGSSRLCWGISEMLSWIALFLNSVFWTSQEKRIIFFSFSARKESIGLFQHGAGITTVNLPAFNFLSLSSDFLLLWKSQMLISLWCLLASPWVSCRVYSFYLLLQSIVFYGVSCAVQRHLSCPDSTTCWFHEAAPYDPGSLCSASLRFGFITLKSMFFKP